MDASRIDNILVKFSEHVEHILEFPDISDNVTDDLKKNIKTLYDSIKQEEIERNVLGGEALKTLIVDNFDLEQIWQQLELQNSQILEKVVPELSQLLVAKNRLVFDFLSENEKKKSTKNEFESDSDYDSKSESDDLTQGREFEEMDLHYSDSDESNTKDEKTNSIGKVKQKGSIVDDEFFKLNEMEQFLEKSEKEPEESNYSESDSDNEKEGSINLFENDDEDGSEDEAKTARFKDYFVAKDNEEPKRKKNKLMEDLDEEDSDYQPAEEIKSMLEQRQERLKRRIDQIEEQAVSEKPWQLKGEVTAEKRPQNSLLAEVVEFDLTSRPAPIITTETSLQLEDIIRQRLKDKVFDSVERKLRPVETPFEYKKQLVLNQEKSKESLAQIYEKEFLEQQAALEKDKLEAQEEEPELHKEVKKLMDNLFRKLDALSNYHFTSTPALPELKIVNNLPAVNMEEVAPVAYSEAALLAPEEVKSKPKGDVIGKGERTNTDKKRERRKKKLKQKIHAKKKAEIEKKKNGKVKKTENAVRKHQVKS
ncbi:hypothetical protein ABEB36_009822 [Hypothenemus hampei]|uniref:U3 small nucleolar ribonucleoprotein protein MPP10 n=1 Tax=Hypothenemus hampei TaxID=57062 RepID=A0ABD1EJR0_HYPHA